MPSTTSPAIAAAPSVGFPPVADPDARILILGSLPGQRSLREQRYYAHPQNAFWRIMGELVGAIGPYAERCASLQRSGIALWDVLLSSPRPGSMDADISPAESEPNDFITFLSVHPAISRIGFNGRAAAQLFEKLVLPRLPDTIAEQVLLPSTSPAYASMAYTEKLKCWRTFIAHA